ncbi:MAG TPA: DUF3662 and FHA domain-containing protein [Segeticoccus sp.]|uniref:DUF3662 and FHA domain-containing protein n=1 Tax=Segeticoccus sp. TaxID=2706531 RepID=UPI002D7FDAA6|nr:DUF3662 and FHA domain-containing protein [Segeticoccus sp.]HET8599199.1 DUF3662 and FHA domain-containing protein [Segeticoccus sp.]
MGLFDKLEQTVERAVNGVFAKAFRSEVQPVEIAAAMRRAMDDRAAVVGRGRTIVPNLYTVELSDTDYDRLTAYSGTLTDELIASAQEHAESQRYTPGGPLDVEFVADEQLETGVFRLRPASGRPRQREPERPHRGDSRDESRAGRQGYAEPAPERPAAPHAPATAGAAAAAAAVAAGAHTSRPESEAYAADPSEARDGHGAWGRQGEPSAYRGDGDRSTYRDERAGQAPRRAPSGDETVFQPPEGARPPRRRPEERPWLEIDGQRYPLMGAHTILGRDGSADIVLDDPGISRRHTEIRVTHDGPHLVATIRDLSSTNGTFVDGERIRSHRLNDGDQLTLGRTRAIFHAAGRK